MRCLYGFALAVTALLIALPVVGRAQQQPPARARRPQDAAQESEDQAVQPPMDRGRWPTVALRSPDGRAKSTRTKKRPA